MIKKVGGDKRGNRQKEVNGFTFQFFYQKIKIGVFLQTEHLNLQNRKVNS